jgi:hypothetical protein
MVLLKLSVATSLNKKDDSDEDGVQIAEETDYLLEEYNFPFQDKFEFHTNIELKVKTNFDKPRSKRSTNDILKSYVDNLKAV